MNKVHLQQSIGLTVIFGHLTVMLYIMVYFFLDYLSFPEMTTSLALVSPMFAIYTTAIIKHFTSHQLRAMHPGPRLSFPFVLISFLFPTVYILLAFVLLTTRADARLLTSFDQFSV